MTRPSVSAQFLARRLAITVFWTAIGLTFFAAVAPSADRLMFADQDKLEHFGVFFVLAILATTAYPRRALAVTGMALLAFGALIEVAQALPIVGRDADLWDVAADGGGVFLAASLLCVTGARFKLLRLLRPTPDFVNAVHGR